MTKEIIISISGLQFTGEGSADSLEMIAPGEYYFRNGKHYVTYEEIIEGFQETNKNLIKIDQNRVEVTKKGLTNVNMIFEEHKRNQSCYTMPFGNLMIGTEGKSVKVTEEENQISVHATYALYMNYEFVLDCEIQINIRSKEMEGFAL